MSSSKERKVRLFLEQDGLCHYCNKPMFLTLHLFTAEDKIKPRVATIEHLDDKFSKERGQHQGEKRRVLACHKCNQERGRQRCEEHKDEHIWRSVTRQRVQA